MNSIRVEKCCVGRALQAEAKHTARAHCRVSSVKASYNKDSDPISDEAHILSNTKAQRP